MNYYLQESGRIQYLWSEEEGSGQMNLEMHRVIDDPIDWLPYEGGHHEKVHISQFKDLKKISQEEAFAILL